jgi:hypothetical protein
MIVDRPNLKDFLMTPEQKAEMLAMLKQLSPADQRVIKYEANGGHRCESSTNLVTCCEAVHCQACYVLHLKQVHSNAMLYAYQKFVNARSLTWQSKEYKLPLKDKVARTFTQRAKNEHFDDPTSITDAISDDNLESILEMLKRKLGR